MDTGRALGSSGCCCSSSSVWSHRRRLSRIENRSPRYFACCLLSVLTCLGACASYSDHALTSRWRGRDVSGLVTQLGLPDVDTIRGEHREYEWYRLGPCAIKAETTLEKRVKRISAKGTGCSTYWREKD